MNLVILLQLIPYLRKFTLFNFIIRKKGFSNDTGKLKLDDFSALNNLNAPQIGLNKQLSAIKEKRVESDFKKRKKEKKYYTISDNENYQNSPPNPPPKFAHILERPSKTRDKFDKKFEEYESQVSKNFNKFGKMFFTNNRSTSTTPGRIREFDRGNYTMGGEYNKRDRLSSQPRCLQKYDKEK
jgi:hypothetical protein